MLLLSWSKEILLESKKHFSKNFGLLLEKAVFKNWIAAIFKATFESHLPDVKKSGVGFVVSVADLVELSADDQTKFWSDILTIATKELDSVDPELRESAADLVAKIPPLQADLQKVVLLIFLCPYCLSINKKGKILLSFEMGVIGNLKSSQILLFKF